MIRNYKVVTNRKAYKGMLLLRKNEGK